MELKKSIEIGDDVKLGCQEGTVVNKYNDYYGNTQYDVKTTDGMLHTEMQEKFLQKIPKTIRLNNY